jgi:hypothetical protein
MSPRRSVTRGTPDNRRCQRLRPVARPCRDEGLARRRILGGRAGAAGLSRALPARLYLSLPAPGLETPTARRCSRLRPHRETSSALKRAISPTCRPITRPSAVVGSNRGSAQTRWMQHERSPPRSKGRTVGEGNDEHTTTDSGHRCCGAGWRHRGPCRQHPARTTGSGPGFRSA